MPAPEVTREDLKRVEDRVGFVAQEVDGEKLLSRYILQQARQNGDDLAALKTRVERIEDKVDKLEQKLEIEIRSVKSEIKGLREEFNGLREEFKTSQSGLPGMIGEVMREVLREDRRK